MLTEVCTYIDCCCLLLHVIVRYVVDMAASSALSLCCVIRCPRLQLYVPAARIQLFSDEALNVSFASFHHVFY